MSHAQATAHYHEEEHRTSTGLSHNKLLMWTFLASDCMFFGSLIMTYMIYRNRSITGPYPHDVLNIPYTSVSAGVLLLSSLTMVLALASVQRGNIKGFRIWLTATGLLGLLFLGGQFFEFTDFYHRGLSLSSNLFGSSFFVLTGFHGTHVGIGIIWLLSLVVMSFRGGITKEQSEKVEVAGLYWHFVDIVWIIIFTFVYLVPYFPQN